MKRFLKGYSYREFVLKFFEAEIEGEYDIMPNFHLLTEISNLP